MPRCRYRSAVLVSFVCGDSFADVQVRRVAEMNTQQIRTLDRSKTVVLSLSCPLPASLEPKETVNLFSASARERHWRRLRCAATGGLPGGAHYTQTRAARNRLAGRTRTPPSTKS